MRRWGPENIFGFQNLAEEARLLAFEKEVFSAVFGRFYPHGFIMKGHAMKFSALSAIALVAVTTLAAPATAEIATVNNTPMTTVAPTEPTLLTGLTMLSHLNLGGGMVGDGSGGTFDFVHDVNATSYNTLGVLVDSCGEACPDPLEGLGDGTYRAFGDLGVNASLNTIGSAVSDGSADPLVLQFGHQLIADFGLQLVPTYETPEPAPAE